MSLKLVVVALILLLLIIPYFYFDGESLDLNADKRASVPGQFIHLAGGIVHYEIAGPRHANTVVLVHGASVPYHIWDRNFEALAQAGFRVLRYDMYGRGYSDRPDVVYNLELFDRQLVDLLSVLSIDEKVDLIGVSMGAAVCAFFASRHPEKVLKLCMIDPVGVYAHTPLTLRLMRTPLLGGYLARVFGDNILANSQRNDFCKPEACPDEYLEKYRMQMRFKGFKRAILSTLRHVPITDMSELYGRVARQQNSVLLLWGREDRTAPFADSQRLRKIMPAAEFQAIDRAGHLPQYEQPEVVNPLLIRFLGG